MYDVLSLHKTDLKLIEIWENIYYFYFFISLSLLNFSWINDWINVLLNKYELSKCKPIVFYLNFSIENT